MTTRQALLRTAGTVALTAAGHQVLTGRAGVRGAPDAVRPFAVAERNLDSELRFYAAWYAMAGLLMHKAAHDPAVDEQVCGPIAAGWGASGASRLLSLRAVGRPDPVFLVLTAAELSLAVLLGRRPRAR